jgi:hypothetical protein
MPTISLPDDLFARLQDLAIPLVDSPADVVRRMLDERETAKPEKGKLPMEEGTGSMTRRTPLSREASLTARSARERGATIEINGHEIRAVTVTDMYEQALKFFVDNGHSKRLKELMPFRTSSQRYLIADRPVHPNGNEFFVRVTHNGFFMEAHKSYRTAIEHLAQLAEKIGLKLRYLG